MCVRVCVFVRARGYKPPLSYISILKIFLLSFLCRYSLLFFWSVNFCAITRKIMQSWNTLSQKQNHNKNTINNEFSFFSSHPATTIIFLNFPFFSVSLTQLKVEERERLKRWISNAWNIIFLRADANESMIWCHPFRNHVNVYHIYTKHINNFASDCLHWFPSRFFIFRSFPFGCSLVSFPFFTCTLDQPLHWWATDSSIL